MSNQLDEYRSRLREALGIINDLKSRIRASEHARSEAIAIVGVGCRFPGNSKGSEGFWTTLEQGVDAVREIPDTRWPSSAIPGDRPDVRWAALLDDIENFDAGFFGISPREASSLDPQQRLLLEVAWEALEDGGELPSKLIGSRAGVFLGLAILDYQQRIVDAGMEAVDTYSFTGNLGSTAAGRLSFVLGLQGPCVTIDTACSSSLVAIHQACQSLRNGECELALAGGVNAIISPYTMAMLAQTNALSPDGRCKTFDARANGYVRGEGCGIIILKKLSAAIRDGNRIRALIRGSAVNQDGRSTGLTTPNVLSQQALLRQALENARLTPDQIGYIELHGTGTPLGDPIEFDALREVLGGPRANGLPCILGALKTNVGHLEGAAGIAGVIKMTLALEHEKIPKNLHFRALNPRIDLEDTPFVIPTTAQEWRRGALPRIGGVNSFGISGTNAHIILEEAPVTEPIGAIPEQSAYLLPLSAKTLPALQEAAQAYAQWIAASHDVALNDIVFTAGARRTHHDFRLAVIAQSHAEFARILDSASRKDFVTGSTCRQILATQNDPKIVFVFPGQGSQWLGMGRQLLEHEPGFRTAFEQCDAAISREGNFSVLAMLTSDESTPKWDTEIDRIQPLLFAIEVALATLWLIKGIKPACVIGHSMGEIAAAHIAGALSLDDAVKVIVRRSRLMKRLSGKGAMAFVDLPIAEAENAIAEFSDRIGIAASNGARSTVISGDPLAIDSVLGELAKRGVFSRRVKVDVASHSPQVDQLRSDLIDSLRDLRPTRCTLPMRSTVTEAQLDGGEVGASYWAENLRQPVRLWQVTRDLLQQGHAIFLEISPHPILLPAIEESMRSLGIDGATIATMRRETDERRTFLEAMGALHVHGVELNWNKAGPAQGQVVSLPTYRWQREHHWIKNVPNSAPTKNDPIGDYFYTIDWVAQAREQPTNQAPTTSDPWLIFLDDGGFGHAIASRLKSLGSEVICVSPGPRFEILEPHHFSINYATSGDFVRLLKACLPTEKRFRGLIYLASLDGSPPERLDLAAIDGAQRLGTLGAVHLLQAVLRHGWRDKPPLWLVTRGAVATDHCAVSSPQHASLWGIGHTISLEYTDLTCKRIDLQPRPSSDEIDSFRAELEWPDDEDQIAIRNGVRHVARIRRQRVDAPNGAEYALLPNASYLITGGLGGLGLTIATWMLERGARHVVLLARREPDSDVNAQLRQLEETHGAQIYVWNADISSSADVARIFSRFGNDAPPLRGVIHAAGVRGESTPLLEMTEGAYSKVIAAKIRGSWNLHEHTKSLHLDFFVLYSSVAAALGFIGQGSYAAANAFLDALSSWRNGINLPSMSIQWGAIASVGMLRDDAARARLAGGGIAAVTPNESLSALSRLLRSPRANIAFMKFSPRQWLDVFPQGAKSPYLQDLLAAETQKAKNQSADSSLDVYKSITSAPRHRRSELLEQYVQGLLGRVLRLSPERIGRQAPFQSLGADSLMSLELRNALESAFGLTLPATLLFTYPHLSALTDFLANETGILKTSDESTVESLSSVATGETDEPIAVIGMGCRFPGNANGLAAFWNLMAAGVDAVHEIPESRWPKSAIAGGRREARWAALLDQIEMFDAGFFGISPREAESLDPQQRMLLEVTWEALEEAGQVPDRLFGSQTGVFIGICNNDYQDLITDHRNAQYDAYCATGNAYSTAAGRISFFFGFQGPAISIDTACSSSLVSIAHACRALRAGDANLMVAGGVNSIISPRTMARILVTQALSPDGRCKTLDARANGFVRGEGCGIVILKRLSDAQRDGDRIRGVIRGWAVNQDGRSTGLTTPNVLSQKAMLRQALVRARLTASDIGYVEMHGTGTSLGDPIEAEALRDVLGAGRSDDSACVLGALKTNIGHLEGAAGIAGAIKVLLALEHEQIPKNLHFHRLNPRITFQSTPFVVPTENLEWRRTEKPRRAGVSSFGISGTNAHIIFEEAPIQQRPIVADPTKIYMLPLSAKTPAALTKHARIYASWLKNATDVPLQSIAYTASSRRPHHEFRLAVSGNNHTEIIQRLDEYVRTGVVRHLRQGRANGTTKRRIAFVFSGQGSQWAEMGQFQFDHEPVFRAKLEEIDDIVRRYAAFSIIEEMLKPEQNSRLAQTEVAQVALFAIQVSLTELLASMGVKPNAVIGHSVGEVAAAHTAGILSLEEAIRLVTLRGKIMQKATGNGKMVWAAMPPADAQKLLSEKHIAVAIGAINDPSSVVFSGDAPSVDTLVADLGARGISTRPLRVNYAFHSSQMDALARELENELIWLEPGAESLPMYSTVIGDSIEGQSLSANYWRQNVRDTVNLASAVGATVRDGHDLFLEIGPHPVLTANIEQCFPENTRNAQVLSTLRRQTTSDDNRYVLFDVLASLYVEGYDIDWNTHFANQGDVVSLPAYPWQHERFWVEPKRIQSAAVGQNVHPLLGIRFDSSIAAGEHVWQQWASTSAFAYLSDHRVREDVVFPGTGYLEMVISATKAVGGGGSLAIEYLALDRMMVMAAETEIQLQTVLQQDEEGYCGFAISSRTQGQGEWVRHATSRARVQPIDVARQYESLSTIESRCSKLIDSKTHYERMDALGLHYGPAFRGVQSVRVGNGEVLGHIVFPPALETSASEYQLHPAFMDACLQAAGHAFTADAGIAALVLTALLDVRIHGPLSREVWVHGIYRGSAEDGALSTGVVIYDESHQVVVEISELRVTPIAVTTPEAPNPFDEYLFNVGWVEKDLDSTIEKHTQRQGDWLIFANDGATGSDVAAQLQAPGIGHVIVRADTQFMRRADGSFGLDPTDSNHIRRLLQEAFGGQRSCAGVAHFLSLDSTSRTNTSAGTIDHDLKRNCMSALRLVQALVTAGWRDVPRLYLFTRAVFNPESTTETISITGAALWGLGRTIAIEHPALECTLVDLGASTNDGESKAITRELMASDPENQIALRLKHRYVARLDSARMADVPAQPLEIGNDKTYLITGGLGGLGFELAKWMVGEGARHLILVGRSRPSTTVSAEIQALQETGVDIRIANADVAERDAMANILAMQKRDMPSLAGVVHAAASLDDKTILEFNESSFFSGVTAKVFGAYHLHELTRDEKLDFFVLYSSAAALLGSPGQGNYCAANAFLDALARSRRALGKPAMSIAWGPFTDVGLAARQGNRGKRLAARGIEGMSPATGQAIFGALLRQQRPDIGVLKFSLQQWIEFYPQAAHFPFLSKLANQSRAGVAGNQPGTSSLRQSLDAATSDAQRMRLLQSHTLEQLGNVLHLDPSRIDRESTFTNLGIDSLMSLELRNRLQASLKLELGATLLFTYPTTERLVAHLATKLNIATDHGAPPEKAVPSAPENTPAVADDMAQLNVDDLMSLLDEELSATKKRP